MPRSIKLRRTLLLTTIIVAAATLPFIALEAVLRIIHYGYPTSFFIPLDGQAAVSTNERFGHRFFPAAIARTPIVSRLNTPKPANTVRIFVLGDSAAMGIPEPAFSFGRMLRAMLESRYPGVKFEVVNTAMTAINSHVLVPIAEDSARLQPDLFIVLAGNNEVVGPYGPGTVLASYMPARFLIRAGIWFKSTRTAQLMETLRPRNGAQPEKWTGMALFAGHEITRNDPRLTAVYRTFKTNLEQICAIASHAGAGTVISTVPVNLEDSAPFASRGENGANDHYREAQRLRTSGENDKALAQFREARDLDALRFRADSRINAAIREVGSEGLSKVFMADPETAFSHLAEAVFFEHVHMNFAGNYLLARNLLPTVEKALPHGIQARKNLSEPLSRSEVASALGYTEWDADKATMEMLTMMTDPPFTAQQDFSEKKPLRDQTLDALREKWAAPAKLADLGTQLAQYDAALRRHPDDVELHEMKAELLSKAGRHSDAADEYRSLLAIVPDIPRWHANLAHEFLELNRPGEARRETDDALARDPDLVPAIFTAGAIAEREGQVPQAITFYQSALRRDRAYAQAILRLAVLFGKQQRYREAAEHYTAYLRLWPASPEAESNLGYVLVKLGDPAAALHYRRALTLKPDFSEAAYNLAALLERQGQTGESIEYYRLALRSRPNLAEAQRHLSDLLQHKTPPRNPSAARQ